jgi:integrase
MASIHRKGKYWYISYADADKKRHFVSSGILHSPPGLTAEETKEKKGQAEAKAKIQAIELEQLAKGSKRISVIKNRFADIVSRARKTEAEQSGVRLRTFCDGWVEDKLAEVSKSYGCQLKLCKTELYECLGGRADGQFVHFDEEDVTDFVEFLKSKKLGGRSINKRLSIMKEMCSQAVAEALLLVNPVMSDHFQEERALERAYLATAQVESILGATQIVDWHTVTLLGYYCGMRLGDATSTPWAPPVDFEKRTITWTPQKTRWMGKVITLPLHPILYSHLVKAYAMRGENPLLTPKLAGRPISNLSAEFVALIRAAGIDPLQTTFPNGRMMCRLSHHSLRHTFCTLLKRTGAPEKERNQMSGHSARGSRSCDSEVSQVARIYDHVEVEDLRKWIDLLPSLTIR